MDYKKVIYFILFVGIIFIIINITLMYKECPPERIIYRYIPRSFEEEQDSPIPVTELFANLFNQPDTWTATFGLTKRTRDNINKYFITQK